MTHETAYTIVGTSDANATGLTFYEACKALDASADRTADAAHIRRDGRAVAFFSGWVGHERELRAMWQATPAECDDVSHWHG